MSCIPDFKIGIWNAWIFMSIYPLQWLMVVILPKHIAEKTSHPADFKQGQRSKVMGRMTGIVWIVATLYSIFLPLHIGTAFFYAGLVFFFIGFAMLILATLTVTSTPINEPFTRGVYRFSRHPMYLSMIITYIGVSLAATSWCFLLITIATYFLQRYQMIQEEKYCSKKFGPVYGHYLSRTPRWIGMSGKNRW